MSKVTFKGKQVALNVKPGTLYRLAQAGFSLVDDLQDPTRQMLVAVELLRICAKTELSSEQVADSLRSMEPLLSAIMDLLDEETAKQETKGTKAGN